METKINVSDLKNEGSDVVKELAEYLQGKTNAEVETGTTEMTVKSGEGETVSRTYLRVLLRKFLHKSELKDRYRVIGGKDNTLVVKEKRIAGEEEE